MYFFQHQFETWAFNGKFVAETKRKINLLHLSTCCVLGTTKRSRQSFDDGQQQTFVPFRRSTNTSHLSKKAGKTKNELFVRPVVQGCEQCDQQRQYFYWQTVCQIGSNDQPQQGRNIFPVCYLGQLVFGHWSRRPIVVQLHRLRISGDQVDHGYRKRRQSRRQAVANLLGSFWSLHSVPIVSVLLVGKVSLFALALFAQISWSRKTLRNVHQAQHQQNSTIV
ncbi:hypothetical protein Tsp_07339 [Trichinella spiralis]|uniref:hypothetical protein n=1 Tax=Trichinella spiralis TaxID=6334 RepID=UPI0001EFC762|nr:hypothetical protein Tsp_07339 [Trichinella spiralis]